MFKGLKDGWNGNNAGKFDEKFLDMVEEALMNINGFFDIFPITDGIQAESETFNRYLEFDIFGDRVECYCSSINFEREETREISSYEDITKFMNEILGVVGK
jgi:hypothetical protein